jgi:SAM-dependent methyltransferase
MSAGQGEAAADSIVINDELWTTGQPVKFSPARVYFSRRKLQSAVSLGGARRGAKILEVGCTSGTFTLPMQRLGFDVTGFDIDEGALDKARTWATEHQLENIRFEQGDAHDLSRFPDDSFDHVFSFQCYRYFPDLDTALREVLRVLKPGGVSCIDYPNRLSPFYSMYKRYVKGHKYKFPDYTYVSRREAEERYRGLGFGKVDAEAIIFAPPYTPTPLLPLMKLADSVLEVVPGINALAGIVMVRAEK